MMNVCEIHILCIVNVLPDTYWDGVNALQYGPVLNDPLITCLSALIHTFIYKYLHAGACLCSIND